MIGVGIVLTITVIVLLAVGISTHTEPGLMSVCWDTSGMADGNTLSCETPEELKWRPSDFPLSVSGPATNTEIPDAVDLINSQVGCTLLVWAPEDTHADIVVTPDDALLVGSGTRDGSTGFTRNSAGDIRADVRTYNVSDPYLRYRTMTHELGHALGLAHDPFETSIMFPENPEADADMDFIRFTDSDTALLRGFYCP